MNLMTIRLLGFNQKATKLVFMIFVLATLLINCHTSTSKVMLVDDFRNQESVEIRLTEYGLEEVPAEINQLQEVKRLTISRDSLPTGWTIYPPQSAFENQKFKPPLYQLPDEITQLTGLTSLRLISLDLVKLPENLHFLENLDTLDLSLNKLTIKDELEKLKSLPKLKFLALFGNKAGSAEVAALKKAIPGLVVDIDTED